MFNHSDFYSAHEPDINCTHVQHKYTMMMIVQIAEVTVRRFISCCPKQTNTTISKLNIIEARLLRHRGLEYKGKGKGCQFV